MKYYLIETIYVGSNPHHDDFKDAGTVVISTAPAISYKTKRGCSIGFCSLSKDKDWAAYAHGEYDTFIAARAAIKERFGVVRDADPDGNPFPE